MKVLSLYLTKQNLLIAQDLWQVHHQILLIISQNKFIKLSVKTVIVFLNMKVSRTICKNLNALLQIKINQTSLIKKIKKHFKNTFKFSYNDISKFILLLRKGVYPYEYMDDQDKCNGTTLPEKEEFYSNLNMENITDFKNLKKKKFQVNIVIFIMNVIDYFWLFSKTLEKCIHHVFIIQIL